MTPNNSSTLRLVLVVLVVSLSVIGTLGGSNRINLRPQIAAPTQDQSELKLDRRLDQGISLMPKLERALGLSGTGSFEPALPQAPAAESVNTFADDCMTPKTDFNFGETICAVVSDVILGRNSRLVWGHTDGFLAREITITSTTQADQLMLTPTSILGGVSVDNRGTWRIRIIDVEGAPIAETSFTIHDPQNVTGDLSVYKFNQKGDAKVNENTDISFEISVSNFGPDTASNVELQDFTPAATTFISLTQISGPTFTCTGLTCTISSLARGARANFLAIYHANGVASEVLTSYLATVSSDTTELRPADNTASGEFSIVAVGAPTACTLDCPDNINAVANTTVGGERGAVVTFDAAVPTGDCGAVTATPASGTFFPVGTTTVTVNSAMGGGTCSFTVNVEDTGTNPPTISCPVNQEAVAGNNCEASVTVDNPTTTGDNVTVVGTRSDGRPLTDPFSAGTTTISWTAYSHNSPGPFATPEDEEAARTGSASCTQVITVSDVTPPAITLSPQTIAADASCEALVPDFTATASVTDNCACLSSDQSQGCQDGPSITVTQSPAAGTVVGLGTHTITLMANDGSSNNGGAGNTTTVTTTLTVADQTAPVVSCPTDIVVYLPLNTPDTSMAVSYPAATATDNCSTPTITYSHDSGSLFPVGTTTVTATATDAAGNPATCTFKITVLYNFTGFFPPVSNTPTLNVVNAGRAIPVKFSLSGNKGLNIFAPNNPFTLPLNCDTNAAGVDVTETLTAGGSSLSFGGDQYTYVWKTESSWAGTCRQLVVTLNDGSVHTASFKFR